MTWTEFYDMSSGGRKKTEWDSIFVELPAAEAIKWFKEYFGRDPLNVTCSCCGPDFDVDETSEPENWWASRKLVINKEEVK